MAMKIAHVIEAADVGDGVYRHPFKSSQRSLLVEISTKFGGIMKCDVGKKIYRSRCGQLVMQGTHKDAPK